MNNIAFLIKFGMIIYLVIRLTLFVFKRTEEMRFMSWEKFEKLCEEYKKKKITEEEFNERIRG